ncbi:hypothetical protein CcrSwift_gp317 [Caulobacter phage CcrSwift]|uniref:Uncharacterized protein n=6 Tax=Viruses TaxID=10239 RepID=J3SMJ4_9CAUD|nr:hypothetical protein D865_gp108 [Caulobacter phage phiCbK]YP_006990050.1 hypothetical protein D870_gp104 [Caulobacter phage CcrSwift]ARB13846.1 hypothetical protein Ccr10_gp316 [Caulobacter phage Ccr10]ARB14191.1 hypothetical protein Ccr2_gp315 [Caulobacter phage Ccr2]ARB14885.1 hypothetical protein Ccr29_gp329 [Caulobacter phage Ccr29]ARB15223.1 hypothetical protein Ccr32_gp305 [Caulobacter phage Ccr32]ARB15557.1 hypothetical protein Ccr34_gp315 [Caulobacter phage Ccr34]
MQTNAKTRALLMDLFATTEHAWKAIPSSHSAKRAFHLRLLDDHTAFLFKNPDGLWSLQRQGHAPRALFHAFDIGMAMLEHAGRAQVIDHLATWGGSLTFIPHGYVANRDRHDA